MLLKKRPLEQNKEEASLVPEQCLNCGALVTGRYCAECGQEHSEKIVSLGRLIGEFLEDTFTVDSKLWKTVLLLLFRPGFLTNEYNAGRRARYLSPWRIYVFTSVLLFFVLSLKAPPVQVRPPDDLQPIAVRAAPGDGRVRLTWRGAKRASYVKIKRGASDEGPFTDVARVEGGRQYVDAGLKNGRTYYYEITAMAADGERAASEPVGVTPGVATSADETSDTYFKGAIHVGNRRIDLNSLPDTEEEYLAAQRALPPGQREGWFMRGLCRKAIHYRNAGIRGVQGELSAGILENLPKGMFVLLPLFALLLKMLYARRQRLYVEHLILALHLHAFAFLVFTVAALARLERFNGAAALILGAYTLVAMRVVYRQSWWKTAIKWGVLGFSYVIVLSFTLLGVVVATVLTG